MPIVSTTGVSTFIIRQPIWPATARAAPKISSPLNSATRAFAAYVAPMTAYLCTDEAWDVNGKIFSVSGGTVSLLHDEVPMRTITKDGKWTVAELRELVPVRLMRGLPNPAPPPADLELPGRPVPVAQA